MPERLGDRLDRLPLPGPVRAGAEIVARTVDDFLEDGGPRLSAALAYYLLIALAPLLILVVSVAGLLFERAEVRDAILLGAYRFLGDEGVVAIDQVLRGVMSARAGGGTALLGVAVAIFGASAAFSQLQAAINIAWDIRPRPEGFREFLRRRSLTFLLVLVVGVLLLFVAVLFGAGFSDALVAVVPDFTGMAWLAEKSISVLGAALLFAIVFTILPDRRVAWQDTLVGALVTALLFNAGSVALGAYLARSSIGSVYGAAGSFAVVLVWLYYSTQVFLLGAEFTHVWATRRRAIRAARAARSPE